VLAELLYLSRRDLLGLGIDMPLVIEVVEQALRELGLGRVTQPEKVALHYTSDRVLHAMPAWVPAQNALGIKWVGSVAANHARGLPQTSGIMVLNDPETGFPLAVLDGTWITAMRTGAVSAIAAKHLAPARVEVLGLIGCGVQMRTQLLALATVLRPQQVRIHDVKPEAMEAFARQMRDLVDVPIELCAGPREVVEGADLAVSATYLLPPKDPPLKAAWLKPGVLALPIDVDSVWEPAAYLEADRFVTDRWHGLQDMAEHGWFPAGLPRLDAELAEIVAGLKPGRRSPNERIVAMNGGMALEDVALAGLAYARATERGLGTRLPFIGSPEEIFEF
jgi:ornithine cyclodeaminase/alanine dehydrogenase-like protein (mu-crystallin family)